MERFPERRSHFPMRLAILKWLLPAILATGGWAQEFAADLSVGHNFPAVGVVPGQTIRITALNTARKPVQTAMPSIPCRVSVTFYDASGQVVHEGTIDDLALGTAKWVDYSPQVAILVFPPPRIALAAVVRVGTTTPLPATSAGLLYPICSVIPTLEVFDTSSNKTTIVLSGPVLAPPILPTPRRAAMGGLALAPDTQE
jgi:hypothetical protein